MPGAAECFRLRSGFSQSHRRTERKLACANGWLAPYGPLCSSGFPARDLPFGFGSPWEHRAGSIVKAIFFAFPCRCPPDSWSHANPRREPHQSEMARVMNWPTLLSRACLLWHECHGRIAENRRQIVSGRLRNSDMCAVYPPTCWAATANPSQLCRRSPS